MKIAAGGRVREVRVEPAAAHLDGRRIAVEVLAAGAGEIWTVDGRTHRIRTARTGERVFVWCDGEVYEFHPARRSRGGAEREDLVAPMPGRVRKLLVSPGERVARGDVLVVLEAMKMEHAIRAPHEGVVSRVAHGEGDLVEAGTALVELE
jgi:3-methylcrotonyl-CoA carboxylase alpha subunit